MITRVMRAIVVNEFGGPSVCKFLSDAPIPTIKPNEVLVRVHASGVNPVDTYIRSGIYPRLPTLPYTPGGDSAGVIEKVGSDVQNYKVGDRVYTFKTVTGTYAEYCVSDAQYVFPLPSTLTFEEGSALGSPYFTAYRALAIKGKAKPNETVLIHGASGGVGIATVQIAKALGLSVIGTASTEAGQKIVQEQGADFVFNHKKEGYLKEIQDATKNGQGVDLIIEMLANVNLQNDLNLLRPNVGRIVVVGNRGNIEITPRLMMGKETSIIGMTLFASTDDEIQMMSSYFQHGLKYGYFKPVLGKIYELEDAAQVHHDIIENSGTVGRLTLKI